MKTLKLKNESDGSFPEDVDRIISICKTKGYDIDYKTAEIAWEKYSDSMCAGWLMLGDDDEEIFNNLMSQLEEEIDN
jgi:hypothetical protein